MLFTPIIYFFKNCCSYIYFQLLDSSTLTLFWSLTPWTRNTSGHIQYHLNTSWFLTFWMLFFLPMFVPRVAKRPLNSFRVFKTEPRRGYMTKGSRKLAETHTCLEWLSCSDSFFPFQQMTAVVDKRCWFRGQIKPRTGKIMCLWSINTDTRCTGFTLKLSGPANGPFVPFSWAALIISVACV